MQSTICVQIYSEIRSHDVLAAKKKPASREVATRSQSVLDDDERCGINWM